MPTPMCTACISERYPTVITVLVLALYIGLGTAFTAAADDTRLEVVPLKHRTAEQLLPIVRPLLEDGEAASGTGDTLVLRLRNTRGKEFHDIIERLDVAARRLLITVRHAAASEMRDDGAEAAVRGEPQTPAARVHIYATGSRDARHATQRLQTLEGQPAFIQAGESVPVAGSRTLITGPGGTAVQESVEYQDVTTGFQIVARLIGEDGVVLEIAPHTASLSPEGGGRITVQQAHTRVRGRLGEWIPLGATQRNRDTDGSGRVRCCRLRRHDHRLQDVFLRGPERGALQDRRHHGHDPVDPRWRHDVCRRLHGGGCLR